jgi:dTDP-4-amino-4,6-dideoxygalactose transaminase
MSDKKITDYNHPFDAIKEFEEKLAEYCGSPYAVATDCCTHAIELCLRYEGYDGPVILPHRSYLSLPMVLQKLGLKAHYDETDWKYEYKLAPTRIWDAARGLREDMYRSDQLMCLSFGWMKRMELGRGGAILCDKKTDYYQLRKMANDGRDLDISPWPVQNSYSLGFHYNMQPEMCVRGINALANDDLKPLESQVVEYPDLRQVNFDF